MKLEVVDKNTHVHENSLETIDQNEQEIVQEIENFELLDSYTIPKELISNKANKQFLLYENPNPEFSYKLKNKWYTFTFEKPIFCKNVVLRSHNHHLHGLEVVAFDHLKKPISVKINNKENGNIRVSVNKIALGFKIKPHLRLVDKVDLKTVIVTGYKEEDFTNIENTILQGNDILDRIEENSSALKQELAQTQKSYDEITEEIEEKAEETKELEDAINSLQATKDKLTADNEKLTLKRTTLSEKVQEQNKQISSSNIKIEELENVVSQFRKDSLLLKIEISKLESNKNLFAYDVEDYVRQGNRNIASYTLLSFLPWMIIFYVAYYLFNGAVNITSYIDSFGQNANIIDILLSRIPFTLIAGALIIASYEFSKIFISKILEINAQKLKFSELGIVAKEVSEVSAQDIDLDETELCELRTKLKMDLLKHHLKGLSLDKYEYNINPSIVTKYFKLFAQAKNEALEPEEETN